MTGGAKTYWFARSEAAQGRGGPLPVRWQGWAVMLVLGFAVGVGLTLYVAMSLLPERPVAGIAASAAIAVPALAGARLIARWRADPGRSFEDYARARPGFWSPRWRALKAQMARADEQREPEN